ncbi:hypothetical protein [Endozoicomonas sp. 8E]|uniref:hypothetical protein n=1 Tax=Endozoicomonas sp. 8E TaxID=3035692 RepID=UPI002938D347|nr:hypothetical protein [Endozoicomonas sp. 8E]WOG29626.1 hypothetical protein P6910_08220 [Endozoicomonas sp. 8E]
MTNACPNALSLAVIAVIGSSFTGTQALADRWLQTKSIHIQASGHEEFPHSEVMVRPTLGLDQQPIPNSFTTTYPYTIDRENCYHLPTPSFTQIISNVEGEVSSVDLFQTGDNGVAQKYTKVLKLDDEEVFRFTHNLEETKLFIEVRAGMTDQDSINAVRAFHAEQPLEPLTKIAAPLQLAELLAAVYDRKGKLGANDHYIALATIEVEKVEVYGRTFMRLIASGNQPPALQRLGQSLFINDEALLTAATSAYIQVHVLREDLQQQALKELMAHSKPVGYVVHVDDDTKFYPVPAGYPKLEVAEASGKEIVFHGQRLSPNDIAFVEKLCNLYYLWKEVEGNNPVPAVVAKVKKHEVRNYQHVIRSRQMAILEEYVARHDAVVHDDQPTTLTNEDKLAIDALAHYEYLQQALASNAPARSIQVPEFEFTLEHIRVASSVITPQWLHSQLIEHFNFKPVFRNLLINPHFVQNIQSVVPVNNDDSQAQTSHREKDKKFAARVIGDMNRQLLNKLDKLYAKESDLLRLHNYLKCRIEVTSPSRKEKLREEQQRYWEVKDELAKIHVELEYLENLELKLLLDAQRIPELETQVRTIRADVTKALNAEIAAELGIDNWDDTQPTEKQNRLMRKKIHEIMQLLAATEKPDKETLNTKLVVTDQQHLQQQGTQTDAEREAEVKAHYTAIASHLNTMNFDSNKYGVLGKLTAVERTLNMDDPDSVDDVYHRRQAISEEIQTYIIKIRQQAEEDALKILQTVEEIFKIQVNKDDHKTARLERVRTKLDSNDVSEDTLNTIEHALSKEKIIPASVKKASKLRKIQGHLTYHVENTDARVFKQQKDLLEVVEHVLLISSNINYGAIEKGKAFVAKLANDLGLNIENNDYLYDNKYVIANKILSLMTEVDEAYGDEDVRRRRNNEIASQLNIEVYKDDASIDDQKILIKGKLQQLNEEVSKAGIVSINEHITAIDTELDRQLAHLGPKPRYVLDREVARARQAIQKAETELTDVHRKLNTLRGKNVLFAGSRDDLRHISDKYDTVINQVMKESQTDLALDAGNEQHPEEITEDVKDFLSGYSKEKRDLIVEQRVGKTNTNTQIKGNDEILSEDADYFIVIRGRRDNHDQDKTHEFDERLGELPSLRKKYFRVRQLLRVHDKKNSELTNARLEERNAQESLDLKKEEIKRFGNTGEKAETENKNEITLLNTALEQRSEAASKAEEDLIDFHKTFLDPMEKTMGLKPDATDTNEHRVNALRNRLVKLGGNDGSGGKIQQLTQEQARLESEIEVREANIERMKEVLRAAEKAVENDGGPFQFTPRQVKILTDMDTFTQQHPLRQQALDAALGLADLAVNSGKTIPRLATFDFNGEFAPLRLQALVGDDLIFDQAGRMVEVFKSLKTSFPFEPADDQPQNVIEEVQNLALRARNEIKTGTQQYDNEIHGMGKRATHFVEHKPGDLKDFSEYFAAHSVSGDRIITLLREGLISKIELENYMKAIRGVDGYQTVDEFEHFLGYKHDVHVPNFKKVVRMLSDKAVEAFMQSAFDPIAVTATGPTGMKESVAGMKEYAAAVIANYVLDDIAFENGRRTAAFLTNVRDTLKPYAHAAGISESDLIETVHGTLIQAHAAAVERQLLDYWVKPSAFLVQAVTWYFSSYKPLLTTHSTWQAAELSLSNMSFLYLLDLTNRGDYLHRMLTPFQHWLERYGVDLDRTGQYVYHSGIEQISELGGLAMPLGKSASSVILLRTGSMLFARQYNANPQMYRSISRLVPEIVKSMGSGQGVQIPLLHRVTPKKVKTLASATAGLVLGPVATVGAYAHGLISGFTYAQTFGFALASSLAFDFFMNDNRMLTQWLGGPLGRSLDEINRWTGLGETDDEYVKRTSVVMPQRFSETDEEYTNRVKAQGTMYGWTRHENYLQFRERRDRTMKLFANSWEKYFRESVPKWSFSHAESIPYSYTLGAFYTLQQGDGKTATFHDKRNALQATSTIRSSAASGKKPQP